MRFFYTLASTQTDFINTWGAWITLFIIVGGGAYAALKTIVDHLICKGKAESDNSNRFKAIEDKLDNLQIRIKDQEDSMELKEQESNKLHGEMKEAIATLEGVVQTLKELSIK